MVLLLIASGLGLTATSFWDTAWLGTVVPLGGATRLVIVPLIAIPLAATGLVLSIAGWICIRRYLGQGGSSVWKDWLHGLAPISLMPLLLVFPVVAFLFPRDVVAAGLFFGPVALSAWSLLRLFSRFEERLNRRPTGSGTIGVVILVFSLFYAVVGRYYTIAIGEHAGDEGHYLTQMRSLRFDGDLDIRNNLGNPPESMRGWFHVSQASRDGHWYSWHPFGLSLLLAPFAGFGLFWRHLVLGAISGVGVGGIVLICRYFGARRSSTILFTLLFCLSVLWGIYSSRALPEVLGATLVIWLVAAAFMQERHPWASVAIGAVCAVYLPWAHTRFVPVSLLGVGWYVLAAWRGGPPWKPRIWRVALLGLLCLGGYAAYLAVQNRMFLSGTSYAVRDLILSRPVGIWHALASWRGILYSLPMFAWMLPAAIWLAASDRERRWPALMSLSFLAAVLVTSSATVYTGGTCTPGRHLLVVAPLLVAPAAVMFDRMNSGGRGWLLFLGVSSCALFALELALLPRLAKWFIMPADAIPVIWPVLAGLPQPLTDPYKQSLHLFGLWMYVASILLIIPGARLVRFRTAVLVLTAVLFVIGGRVTRDFPVNEVDPGLNADLLARSTVRAVRFVMGPDPALRPLLDVSNRFAGRGGRSVLVPYATTRGPGGDLPPRTVFQSGMEPSDWAGPGLRWIHLVRPFVDRRGERLFWLAGHVDGSARVVLAVRDGNRTILNAPLTADENGNINVGYRFRCLGRQEVCVFIRLEGDGGFRPTAAGWSPIDDEWLKLCRLTLPADVRSL